MLDGWPGAGPKGCPNSICVGNASRKLSTRVPLFIPIAESIPIAVVVVLSPLPVAAPLMMLLTPRAMRNGPAFLAGWILGISSVAVLTGFMLSGLNPKNLGLTAAGVATIGASMLGPADQAVVFALFTVVASAAILLPLTTFFVYRRRAEVLFTRWKDWLIANNASVLAVLLCVFGVVILGRGTAIAMN